METPPPQRAPWPGASPQAGVLFAPAELYVAHRERVRRSLVRLVGEAEADDLVQEVFVRVTRALPEFRGEAGVTTWIARIARSVGLDHLRSRRHHEAQRTVSLAAPTSAGGESSASGPAAVPEPQEEAQAPGRLVRSEMGNCVREYVARLSPDHRAVIELKDLDGHSNTEIAARLGVSVDNAKIRLHRARQALRRELERGCDFYHNEENTLACDRKIPAAAAALSVSSAAAFSSKKVRPIASARRAKAAGCNQTPDTAMNTSSNCGCNAASAPSACAAPAAPSLFTPIAAEFVALGAAIGANCEPCLAYHVREAEKLGISSADIAKAVAFAAKVKDTPARAILKLAERLTQAGGESATSACATSAPSAAASPCCSG
jgi:RNA polymerase sigma-70 factor (ECF subfamily)